MFKVTTKNETIGIKEISYRNMKKLLCKDFLRFIQSNKTETNIDTSKINNDIKHIITKYKKVFPDDLPLKLPPERAVDHRINLLPHDKPPSRSPYRLSFEEQTELKQIKELIEKKCIEPSVSPFGAPVLFFKKKDGSMRLCIEYRALNKHRRAISSIIRCEILYKIGFKVGISSS